jgi:hypothetical protein
MIFFPEFFSAFLSRYAIPKPLNNENIQIINPTKNA